MSSTCQRRLSSTTAPSTGPGLLVSASNCVSIASASTACPRRSSIASIRCRASRATPLSLFFAPSASLRRPSTVRTRSAAAIRVSACSAASARSINGSSSRMAAIAWWRRSASCVRRATSERIASVQRSASSSVLAPAPSCVSERTLQSADARPSRTAKSVSVSHAAASVARLAQRRAAATRTCGAGSSVSSCASSDESGASSATPRTRCAGSGCVCSAERGKSLLIMV